MSAIYQRVNFVGKLLAIVLGFILFGCGGICMCLIVFPFIILFIRNKQQRKVKIRILIHHIFRIYLQILNFLRLVNVQNQGLDKLSDLKGKLVICNHPSLLDVVIIMSQLKNIQCVVKHKLWTNPFIGMVVHSAGYIRNDINPQSFLKDCREMLDRGENILIFPEGTRSSPDQPIIMSRGVANLALWAKADIQALTLTCTPAWLYKDSSWYDVPSTRVDFVLKVGDQFLFKDYDNDTPRSIQVRALMRKIKQYYERNL